MLLYTSELILLLLSSVALSMKASKPVPVAAIHGQTITAPPCFTGEGGGVHSWAIPFHLHTLLLPSLKSV